MRHKKSGRKLNRTSSHRKALFRNLCIHLIEHEVIKTTVPKAKELRRFFEPLITLAKRNDSVAGRRQAFAFLRDNTAVYKLFSDLAVRSKDRNGGYVRVLKCGFRAGDAAPMAYILLTDRLEDSNTEKEPNADNKKSKVSKKQVNKKSTGTPGTKDKKALKDVPNTDVKESENSTPISNVDDATEAEIIKDDASSK